jgi:beta-galactosidase
VFHAERYEPGKLEAVGYIGGMEVARHTVRTPGKHEKLELVYDESGKPPEAGCNDALFLYILVKDHNGTTVRAG